MTKGVTKIRVSDYIKGRTKWGVDSVQEVSFQKFTDKFCCHQGDGTVEGVIGWGKTKEDAIRNLLTRKAEVGEIIF